MPRGRLIGEGQLSVAYDIGDGLVARYPRHSFGVDRLRFERRLVPLVASTMGDVVALPMPVADALDLPIGEAYAVHRLVPGDRLRAGVAAVDAVADAVAAFLERLASCTTAAIEIGVPVMPLRAFAASLATEVDALLADRLPAPALARAEAELAAMASVDRGIELLCHTDLGGNMTWDRGPGVVGAGWSGGVAPRGGADLSQSGYGRLGVIDFGSAFVSDPVLDLASVRSLDEALASAVASRVPLLAGRMDDAALVQGTFVLQDMLYGARQGDWAYVAGVAAEYGAYDPRP